MSDIYLYCEDGIEVFAPTKNFPDGSVEMGCGQTYDDYGGIACGEQIPRLIAAIASAAGLSGEWVQAEELATMKAHIGMLSQELTFYAGKDHERGHVCRDKTDDACGAAKVQAALDDAVAMVKENAR